MSTYGAARKRQLLFVAGTLGAGLVLTYLFGFLIGVAANIALLLGISFYIRSKRSKALKSFGFSSESAGGGFSSGASTKLKYVCLACGADMNSTRCKSCGSTMKKPVF